LSTNPVNPIPGSAIQLNATLHNTGDQAVVNPQVTFYLGDPNSGGTSIGSATASMMLPGGMTTTLTINWTVPITEEAFSIYAVADPDNTINEADEANNYGWGGLQQDVSIYLPIILKRD
jgi:subtilase family serine protease